MLYPAARSSKTADIDVALTLVLEQIDYAENFRAFDPDPNLADMYQRKNWLLARKRELLRCRSDLVLSILSVS